jgi:RNA polymerase sigma factor (sigma-70 family)
MSAHDTRQCSLTDQQTHAALRLAAGYGQQVAAELSSMLEALLPPDTVAAQVALALEGAPPAEAPRALWARARDGLIVYCLHNGHPRAASLLLLEHVRRLKAVIGASRHGRWLSEEDRTDIAHDTILRAVERGPSYNPAISGLGGWLNMLAFYITADLIRDRGAIHRAGLAALVGDRIRAEIWEDPDLDPAVRRRVHQAIEQLPPGLALFVQRHYLEGWSAAEIQCVMNVAPETVRVWKNRSLKRLRAMLR